MEDCKKALNKLQNTRVVAEKTAIVLRGAFIEAKNKVEKAQQEMEAAETERDIVRDAVSDLADGTATDDELKAAAEYLTEKAMIYAEKMREVVAAEEELDLLPELVTGAIRDYNRFERLQGRAIDLFKGARTKAEGDPLYLRSLRVKEALKSAVDVILESDLDCDTRKVTRALRSLEVEVRRCGGRR